jgi:hypothetical protein
MKRSVWTVGGIISFVLILASAAFVGAGLFRGNNLTPMDFKTHPQNIGTVLPPPELPPTRPDFQGDFIRRDGNSFFVCDQSAANDTRTINQDGTINHVTTCGLQQVEIVVEHDTRLYRDEPMSVVPAPGQTVQRTVGPLQLDDCGNNSTLIVWGQQSGSRILASTLVCRIRPARP